MMASTGHGSINDETLSVAEGEENLDDHVNLKTGEDVKESRSPQIKNPDATVSDSPEIAERVIRVTDIANSVSSSKSSVSDGLPKTSSLPRITCSFSRDSSVYPPIHARGSKSAQVDQETPLSVTCQTTWDWKTDLVLMQESLGISRGVQTVETEDIEGDLDLELPYLREIYDHLDSQYELHTADDKDYDEPVTPGPYLDCGMGPPVILQSTLETRLRVAKLCNSRGRSALAAQYTAHYEIIDSCLLDYIFCTDLKARDRILRSAKVCPFCNAEISPGRYCCERFREYSEDIRRWGEVGNYEQSELGDHDRSNNLGFSGGFHGDGKGPGRERYHSGTSTVGMVGGGLQLRKDGRGDDRNQDARRTFGIGGSKSLVGGRSVRMASAGAKGRHSHGKQGKGGAGDGKHGKHESPDHSFKIKQRVAAAKERAAAAAAAAAARAERLRAAAANRARAAHNTVSQGSDGTQQHLAAAVRADKLTTITYQLSSQKYVEDGWTILPKVPPPKEDDDDSSDENSAFNCVSGLLEPDQPQYQDAVQKEPVTRYYESGALFVVIFADGSGSVFYPSGRLAISIVTMGPGLFTYIVQDDTMEANIIAVFQPTGYSIVYYNNGMPRISINPFGGVELTSSGSRKRGWNWNEFDSPSTDRDPFPTIYPIALGVNCNCGLRIMSQHNISLTFAAECRSCRFHVGARLKNTISKKKLQPLTNSFNKNLAYLKDAQGQIESIFRKMLTVLQFPKSPKLGQILSPFESSRRDKIKKLQDVEEEEKLDSLNSAAASTAARCSCSFKVSVTSS